MLSITQVNTVFSTNNLKIVLLSVYLEDPEPALLSLEEWKYKLATFEHCMISRSRRTQFEEWFQKKNFAVKDSIYQSWLVLKRASIGTETEALDALLEEKTPQNLPKSKSKRNMNYPSGPARYDCSGPEWLELMRSRREKKEKEEKEREKKKSTKKSTKKK